MNRSTKFLIIGGLHLLIAAVTVYEVVALRTARTEYRVEAEEESLSNLSDVIRTWSERSRSLDELKSLSSSPSASTP